MRQRDIFWFWLPLFASWLLMTAEGPIISAAINRLPDEVVMLAAQGIVISLSVTLESPIINLLATSTALVKDRPSYFLVRRFTIHWAALLTLIAILIAFSPLFDLVVVRWLEAPPEVSLWVRPGLRIMSFWSAAIAWRRFQQGVLIHFNQTRKVAWGTAVRLLTSGGIVIGLALWSGWAGVISAATALMAGVAAEAVYATFAVRPLLKRELAPGAPVAEGEPLTYRELFWFHMPLAGTALLTLLAQPLVTSSLARLDRPTDSLAAWPVLFQMMLMVRAAAFALPEVVIALNKGPESFAPIRRFSINVAAGVTMLVAIIAFTPISGFYVFVIQDMSAGVGELARGSLALFLLFPAMATITLWLRGLLITRRATKEVNFGMAINLATTALVLSIGVANSLPGLPMAAAALNLASLCEVIFLGWRTQRFLSQRLPLFGTRRLEIGDRGA
jgi:hypothetical protein